jgi:hypothetical protein
MDGIVDKKITIKEINAVEEFSFQPTTNEIVIFKLAQVAFNNLAFIKEITKEDNLELVSKLLNLNQRAHQKLDVNLINDLNDSQTYLLDIIFDNQ